MSVTNGRDDLRVGVKCQANPEIAGSPRNVFRYSLDAQITAEVAHWNGDGASRLLTRLKRRMPRGCVGSETTGAKFRGREGNSPDRQLRSRSVG